MTHQPHPIRSARRAFTLVELLAAVTVIGILIGIVFIALGGATQQARASLATRQLGTIQQGVAQFETDFGYLPPLLSDYTDVPGSGFAGTDKVLVTPEGQATFGATLQQQAEFVSDAYKASRYSSEYSIAAYLIGIAELSGNATVQDRDGEDFLLAADDGDDGVVGPGLRDPGPDRAWGGGSSRLDARSSPGDPNTYLQPRGGQVYGPYINAADLTDAIEPELLVGGNDNYIGYQVLDPWGNPIRYYLNWPTKDPTLTGLDLQRNRTVDFLPVELRTAESADAQIRGNDVDLNLDRIALNSSFALLSAGAPFTRTFSVSGGDDQPLIPFGDSFLTATGTREVVQQPGAPTTAFESFTAAISTQSLDVAATHDAIVADLETNILIGSQ